MRQGGQHVEALHNSSHWSGPKLYQFHAAFASSRPTLMESSSSEEPCSTVNYCITRIEAIPVENLNRTFCTSERVGYLGRYLSAAGCCFNTC